MNKNLDSFICRNKCEIKETKYKNYRVENCSFSCFCGVILGCHPKTLESNYFASCPECHQKLVFKKEDDGYWVYRA